MGQKRTDASSTAPSHTESGSTGDRSRRWALCASVSDELLNDLALIGLGGGISLDAVEQEINMPSMGEVRLRLELTVESVRFDLRAEDDGRARVTVHGLGDVSVKGTDYEGDTVGSGAIGMPTPPAPLPVTLTALAAPYFELRDDHSLSFGLDLREAELVDLGVDTDAPEPADVDAEAWTSVLNMTSMMFQMMGHELFGGLGAAVGSVGLDLGADIGSVLADLGADPGVADAQVGSGVLTICLPAADHVEGRALPVPVAGRRLGLSLSSSGVDRVAAQLLERAVGGVPMPFDVEIDLGEHRIGGRLRQPRLVSDRFPDLRTSVRTDVEVRLARGRLELAVRSAWLEYPSPVPSMVNTFNRRLGGLWSMAPLRVRLPDTMEVPLIPGVDATVGIRVDDLRVSPDGIGIALAMG